MGDGGLRAGVLGRGSGAVSLETCCAPDVFGTPRLASRFLGLAGNSFHSPYKITNDVAEVMLK